MRIVVVFTGLDFKLNDEISRFLTDLILQIFDGVEIRKGIIQIDIIQVK
ncbi:MAG: hypothetical protein IPH33_12545 [Bacteroidetes bacterium]|nr:hypothetical protein [Bacteroidota bacterium]